MLTAAYLQRSLFKWRGALLVFLTGALIVAGISIKVNGWIPEYVLSFARVISQQSQTKITFKQVHYRFPGYLIFKDVKVFSRDGRRLMLEAPRVAMGFSLPLFSSAIPLHYLAVNGLQADLPAFKDYWLMHHKHFSTWSRALRRVSLRVLVPAGKIYPEGMADTANIPVSMDFKVNATGINARGYWVNRGKFEYEFKETPIDNGFNVDGLKIKNGTNNLNLWGRWQGHDMQAQGFVLYNNLYILDIDARLKTDGDNITLTRLSFSVDKDAVQGRGHCFKGLLSCDADLSYYRRGQQINLRLHSRDTGQGMVFKGASDIYLPGRKVHVDFDDLKAAFVNSHAVKFDAGGIRLGAPLNNKIFPSVDLPLENVSAALDFSRPFEKSIALSTRIWNGTMLSRILVDTSSLPWQVRAQGAFSDVQTPQGVLSGQYKLQTSPQIKLAGTLNLRDGHFTGTLFQTWLARTLQMPSLEDVSPAQFSCDFTVNGRNKNIDDLRLDTPDVHLRGFFHIDADDLVEARGAVRFSQKLLDENMVGRHIMGLVHGAWTLPFEFELSGEVHHVNFQWDKSALKDKVSEHLFTFFERAIDRRMDAHPYYNVTMPNESV